jgi:hypothetical protein
MASPQVQSLDWGDLVTTTLEDRTKDLADNITNNNALRQRISKGGREKKFSGGREIIQELRYAQNQSFVWYSGFEPLNISLNDTMTVARFAIKQAAVSVVISGLEQIQNSGEEQMIELVTARVDTARDSFENQMSASIYSDGTAFGGKQIGGLSLLISKTPTSGVVGGIDRAAQVWWQNLAVNSATDPRGAVTATNIQSYMNSTAIQLKRNSDGIDMIVADNNFYLAYLNTLQTIQRISDGGSEKGVGSGFTSLKYFGAGKSVDVILDGGHNGQIPANTMYFLNEDFFFFRPSAERNYKVIGGDRANVNQDAIVRLYAWAGNLTISNSSLQGVLF